MSKILREGEKESAPSNLVLPKPVAIPKPTVLAVRDHADFGIYTEHLFKMIVLGLDASIVLGSRPRWRGI